MKFNLFLFCLTIGLVVTSCKNRTSAVDDNANMDASADTRSGEEINRPDDNENMEEMYSEDDQGHDEELGKKTIKGKLYTDKGFQPRVAGIFIQTAAFEEDGKDWRDRVRELEGKTLEVKGMVVRHWCGPMEQCLTQGYMDWMREVESLKVLK